MTQGGNPCMCLCNVGSVLYWIGGEEETRDGWTRIWIRTGEQGQRQGNEDRDEGQAVKRYLNDNSGTENQKRGRRHPA